CSQLCTVCLCLIIIQLFLTFLDLILMIILNILLISCSKPVGKPNMFVRGEDFLKDTFPDQARVSFACDSGYEPSGGELTLTCQRWVRRGGGDIYFIYFLLLPENSYALVGTKEILCMAQGWGGRLPTCDAVQCVTPPDVEKATFTPDKESYTYGEVVTYKCSSGLTAIGSLQLTCSDGGKFDVPPPTCTKMFVSFFTAAVQCEDPITGLLDYEDGARPPYGFKSTIKVKCSKGYDLVGEPTLQCTAESKWSPGIPTCKSKFLTKIRIVVFDYRQRLHSSPW
uniref:Sushi domain-containing protein n=1 Tax=Oryzias latipes TaxID=8090 RepID=A0A3P9H665_ORYLA